MKLAAKKNKILSAIMTCVLAITLMAGFPAVKAYAASGTVYSCTINRCYAHPVTGVIEDSGGEREFLCNRTGHGRRLCIQQWYLGSNRRWSLLSDHPHESDGLHQWT